MLDALVLDALVRGVLAIGWGVAAWTVWRYICSRPKRAHRPRALYQIDHALGVLWFLAFSLRAANWASLSALGDREDIIITYVRPFFRATELFILLAIGSALYLGVVRGRR